LPAPYLNTVDFLTSVHTEVLFYYIFFWFAYIFYAIISKRNGIYGNCKEEHNESKPGKNRKKQGLLKLRD